MPTISYTDSGFVTPYAAVENLIKFPRYQNIQFGIGNGQILTLPHCSSMSPINGVGIADGADHIIMATFANKYTVIKRIQFRSYAPGLVTLRDGSAAIIAKMDNNNGFDTIIDFGDFGSGTLFYNENVVLRNETGAVTNFFGYLTYCTITP